ncbi:methyl-accepting chemotaxis protein [Salinibacillus xinjiangensis]|uniref:HAMP domain-containing protein n=1 Tax=Salinibacillus xinjiangensis TaxID=1229268 RepID=A0A6G1X5K8_9BACI|nr:methyl-accepting chemotaxis protein [Salinibacillus xinjiangensis]MRG86209.1 HAMP domain-containing protein [Salinibacillus xinjiangensis]
MKEKHRFSLRIKLVIFTTVLAVITYGTSALFIYAFSGQIQAYLGISEQLYTVMVLFMGILWSGILAYFAAQMLTKPLLTLRDAAHQAADGNIAKDVQVSKSDDEIRSLGLAFNAMLASLRDIITNIEKNFDQTNQSVGAIKDSLTNAENQANTIAQTVGEIASGAENSSSSILQTAQSIEDATIVAGEVQEKAKHSRSLSQGMIGTLDQSKAIIQELVSSVQNISKEQETSLEAVERLEKNAQEVEKIISLVGEIADQTNLLALNASIEAARAGEHGRGFAVVAEEVRKLADESATAVHNISGFISNIQTDVNEVVERIQQQVKFARQEAKKGEESNTAIEKVSASVNEVAEVVGHISDLMDQQLETMEATTRQSQEVAAIAEETTAGTEEVSASIQEQSAVVQKISHLATHLEQHAESLNKQIHKFEK